MEQWEKLVKLVKEFYITFGQQEFLEKEMTNERMELRKKLFDEEFKEYCSFTARLGLPKPNRKSKVRPLHEK